MNSSRCVVELIAAAMLAIAIPVAAQVTEPPAPAAAPPAAPAIPQDLLDSLLAPIALYPDQLLTQVLMASTYPLEVVEAARFVKTNPNLKGSALDDALKDKDDAVQPRFDMEKIGGSMIAIHVLLIAFRA